MIASCALDLSFQVADLSLRSPCVMGIINVSVDSFYGACSSIDLACAKAKDMIQAGVDIIDIGGEATNPTVNIQDDDAAKAQRECDLVVPVVKAIREIYSGVISVDTSQPMVMREAVAAGANMINDQRALSVDGAADAVLELGCPVVLMHSSLYSDNTGSVSGCIVTKVKHDLSFYLSRVMAHGIKKDQIILDPGFGQGHYGKSLEDNYTLLANLSCLHSLGYPLLVGWSRKSMIGDVIDEPVDNRLAGSLSAATIASFQGASILRVHDVAATKQAITVAEYARKSVLELS